MISGRSLDEANPILDTEILIPGVASARVSVVTQPLSPVGLSYSFRRQRDKPWTIPLFIKNRMISPLAAGLMSFLSMVTEHCLLQEQEVLVRLLF